MDRRQAMAVIGASGGRLAAGEAGGPPPDQPRDSRPADADSGSLLPEIEQLAGRGEHPDSFLSGRWRSLEEYRTEGRKRVLRAFGEDPAPVSPRPEVVDRQDLGDLIREKIVFSTRPEFRVPAYVHIPRKGKGRLPAIVDLHSHGGMFIFGKEKVIDFGTNHPVMVEYHQRNYGGRPTATALARRGYVVITIDAFPFGERRLMLDEDLKYGWDRSRYSVEDVQHLNAVCRRKESTLVKSLAYAGWTWPGIVAWDDMRTVDYLVTRPEVDPARIGCVGVSLGGYRSLLLAGLDDRIAAGCVVGFMSTVRSMIRRHMDTHSFVHFIPGVHRRLDLPDVVALRAPKPLLVQQCRRDALYPPAGMEQSVAKLAAIYRKAGAEEAFTGRFYDVPHTFNVAMQDEAFAWFDRHLK
ncbi:MAG: prolyl oligopeptidase family serine peptidase [Bryobacterales bacterium]|nr:prolyl oligopeptidase family serine peptidase [Bryobacterales bacterium]